MNIIDEVKNQFKSGNTLTKFIGLNIAIFILVNLIGLIYFLFSIPPDERFNLVNWLAVPADWKRLLHQPWSIVTYMFLHEGFFHLLSNLIMLYFGGQLFIEYLGSSRFSATYFLGGIAGALLYILLFNLFPVFSSIAPFSIALGASASVLAVFVAIATYLPNFSVTLILFGPVRLKYIALVLVLLDLLSIDKGNAGGHIAHLGGALYGYLAMRQLKNGKDIAKIFNKMVQTISSVFKRNPRPKMKVSHKVPKDDFTYNAQKKSKQERIDHILDKISQSGYDSLSKDEKEELFKMSKD